MCTGSFEGFLSQASPVGVTCIGVGGPVYIVLWGRTGNPPGRPEVERLDYFVHTAQLLWPDFSYVSEKAGGRSNNALRKHYPWIKFQKQAQ